MCVGGRGGRGQGSKKAPNREESEENAPAARQKKDKNPATVKFYFSAEFDTSIRVFSLPGIQRRGHCTAACQPNASVENDTESSSAG